MDDDSDARRAALVAARERLEAEHARKLTALLTTREDLRGVYPLADLVGDRVLWCA